MCCLLLDPALRTVGAPCSGSPVVLFPQLLERHGGLPLSCLYANLCMHSVQDLNWPFCFHSRWNCVFYGLTFRLEPKRVFLLWFGHGLGGGAHRALRARCAKSRLFSTTGSHGSQGPEFCTLQPLLVHRDIFCFSWMFAMGPRVLNSAPPMLF